MRSRAPTTTRRSIASACCAYCACRGRQQLCVRLSRLRSVATGLWLLTTLWFSEPVRSGRAGRQRERAAARRARGLPRAWLAPPATRRQAAAGATLGLLIAFKPTLGLVAAFLAIDWALRGEWRQLAGAGRRCGFALAAVVASSAWFGSARASGSIGSRRCRSSSAWPTFSVANRDFALARLAANSASAALGSDRRGALRALAACAWLGARGFQPLARRATSWWRRSAAGRRGGRSSAGCTTSCCRAARRSTCSRRSRDSRALAAVARQPARPLGAPARSLRSSRRTAAARTSRRAQPLRAGPRRAGARATPG